jgi:hypothetical protein
VRYVLEGKVRKAGSRVCITGQRPGAAMPVPSVTLPARVLASAGMMDTPGPRLLEGEQDGVNQSATT